MPTDVGALSERHQPAHRRPTVPTREHPRRTAHRTRPGAWSPPRTPTTRHGIAAATPASRPFVLAALRALRLDPGPTAAQSQRRLGRASRPNPASNDNHAPLDRAVPHPVDRRRHRLRQRAALTGTSSHISNSFWGHDRAGASVVSGPPRATPLSCPWRSRGSTRPRPGVWRPPSLLASGATHDGPTSTTSRPGTPGAPRSASLPSTLSDHVDRWIAEQTEQPQPTTGKPAAPATVARRLSCLFGLYEYAVVDVGLIESSPVVRVKRPKVCDHSGTVGLDEKGLIALMCAAEADGLRSAALIPCLH